MVPKHRILDDDEAEELLSTYNIEKEKLSKIRITDPVIKEIGANANDLIEITKKSETAGESIFYRLVIDLGNNIISKKIIQSIFYPEQYSATSNQFIRRIHRPRSAKGHR